jgi:hypothetical protein
VGIYTTFSIYEYIGSPEDQKAFADLFSDWKAIKDFQEGNGELFYKNFSQDDLEGLDFRYMKEALFDYDSKKWYHVSDDLKKVSKLFPNLTFVVEGSSEDDYHWREKFCNGKSCCVEASLIFPDFEW